MKTSLAPILSMISILAVSSTLAQKEQPATHNYFVTGGGSTIKGFGETDQIVYTTDFMYRYSSRPLFFVDKWWLKGAHHMWFETPVSVIMHDSDANDDHDFGIVGVTFLAVWVFPEWKGTAPYLLAGGGPRYVLANIEGMGNDICGNYQFGAGTFIFNKSDHPLSIDIRYDHISNGSTAEPNVPLNSVKILLGIRL
jgi:hypothetical protein